MTDALLAPPADPIAAATHADPYPYYARLVSERPLHRHDGTGHWVAASAAAVTALLSHPACRVRPVEEPVPAPLQDSALGELFGRLIRMTDGAPRAAPRQAAAAAFAQLTPEVLQAQAALAARHLLPHAPCPPGAVRDFLLALPLATTGRLLGIAPARLAEVARHAQALVAALSPRAGASEHAAGVAALAPLGAALSDARDGLLLEPFRQRAESAGVDPRTVLANALGFLTQSCEATAGLLGNALVALGRDPALLALVRTRPALHAPFLEEVLRFDPPVQNTRRYLAEALRLDGATLQAGDTVLVLLAAANRDPTLNPEPHRFVLQRAQRRHLSFGLGAHACPAARLALAVAAAGLQHLLETGVDPALLAKDFRYRPSLNGRIPLFGAATEGGRA